MECKQVATVSKLENRMSREELLDFVRNWRERNAAVGLTGMLLHRDGEFLQVLEGPSHCVKKVSDRIRRDEKISETRVVGVRRVRDPWFAGSSLGFENLEDPSAMLPEGVTDFIKEVPFSSKYYLEDPYSAFATLESFSMARAAAA